MTGTAADLMAALAAAADPREALGLSRFFTTGPGEYGEGDEFLGLTVPTTRRIVKDYRTLPLDQLEVLLASGIHEHRFAGLLVLVARAPAQPARGDAVDLRIHRARGRIHGARDRGHPAAGRARPDPTPRSYATEHLTDQQRAHYRSVPRV